MSGMSTVHGKRAGTPLPRPKVPHEGREQKERKEEGPGGPAPQSKPRKEGGLYSGEGSNSHMRGGYHKIFLLLVSRNKPNLTYKCEAILLNKVYVQKKGQMGITNLLFPPTTHSFNKYTTFTVEGFLDLVSSALKRTLKH